MKAVLGDLVRRAERVTAGIVTSAEDAIVDQQVAPIEQQIADYLSSLRVKRGKGKRLRVAPQHVQNVDFAVRRVIRGCEFKTMREVNPEAVRKWVATLVGDSTNKLSARTINASLAAIKAFCSWATNAKPRRLQSNPLERFPMLDQTKNNQKRPWRAMTDEELNKLLTVARLRPIAEFGRNTNRNQEVDLPKDSKMRSTWTKEPLTFDSLADAYSRGLVALRRSPHKVAELQLKGRERELIYKTLVLTGLRKGELSTLTIGDVDLTSSPGWLTVRPENEKAGMGAELPLRGDLADELAGLDCRSNA